jgi:hypothetical protein
LLQQSIKTKLHLQHSLREGQRGSFNNCLCHQSDIIKIKPFHHCLASHCSGERQVANLDGSETGFVSVLSAGYKSGTPAQTTE